MLKKIVLSAKRILGTGAVLLGTNKWPPLVMNAGLVTSDILAAGERLHAGIATVFSNMRYLWIARCLRFVIVLVLLCYFTALSQPWK